MSVIKAVCYFGIILRGMLLLLLDGALVTCDVALSMLSHLLFLSFVTRNRPLMGVTSRILASSFPPALYKLIYEGKDLAILKLQGTFS